MSLKSLRAQSCAIWSVFAFGLFMSLPVRAQQALTNYNSTFSLAQQSVDAGGHTVVIMQGTGDLPGVLTLVLTLGADGTITSGEWALNVSYTAPLHPGAPPDPNSSESDAAQGEQLIQKGVLSGSVAGGSATVSNGLVSTIRSLQLNVSHGTLQFASVTQGNGAVAGANIDNRANSSATSSLTF
jgi:hypothetical protein